jgi:cytochrome c551/c552
VLIGADIEHLVAYFGVDTAGREQVRLNVLAGDPESGRTLFRERGCVRCHDGGVAGAPDLARVARRDPVSFAAAMWNKGPRMMAAMQGQGMSVPRLTGAEMADLTAYLGTLQYGGGVGSAASGARVARTAGCTGCHRIAGTGAGSGGALDQMPEIDSRAAVIAALWNHVGLPADELEAEWRPMSPAQVADLVAYFEARGAVR